VRISAIVVREWKFAMVYLVFGLLLIAVSVINFGYWKRMHRALATEIQRNSEAVLSANSLLAELAKLREERMVTHNLLRDIMENEALIRHTTSAMPDDERVRLIKYRKERRFELFGESLAALGEIKPVAVNWRKGAHVG